jgi:sugar lactone lactonase YvrE
VLLALTAAGCSSAPAVEEPPPAVQAPIGSLEVVAKLYGYMPTGIAVSREGRTFLSFPRWDDGVIYTVAELMPDGRLVPYPDLTLNQADPLSPAESLYSVQSVVVDARGRLWLLDTGRIRRQPASENAAKLVAVDLHTNKVVRNIVMPADQVPPDSYLNDVRFDLSKGPEGCAYVTDSGLGGILVVDLASGKVARRLAGHPSVEAEDLLLVVEGQPLYVKPAPGVAPAGLKAASDGIALSPDGETLYYCPLTSRRLYAVPTAYLRDPTLSPEELAAQVRDLCPKPAVDGMVMDERGRLYLSGFEHNAIMRRLPDGTIETLAQDPRLLWPDTFAIGPDGYLYATVNQFGRQPQFHEGRDLRQRPFLLLRTRIEAGPVLLR